MNKHGKKITLDFFESLTTFLIKLCESDNKRVAGDGSVFEASCSFHKNLVTEDTLNKLLKEATDAVEREPNNQDAQLNFQHLTKCKKIFEQRKAKRKRDGRNTKDLRISTTDPDAMIQRLKRNRGYGPAYNGSVLVNTDKIVTAWTLHSFSEIENIGWMLDQHIRVSGQLIVELLLDANYH
jgi:hypothetical protein